MDLLKKLGDDIELLLFVTKKEGEDGAVYSLSQNEDISKIEEITKSDEWKKI